MIPAIRSARSEPEALAHEPGAEAEVVDAFLSAWADVDVPRIVALLSDDALLALGLWAEAALPPAVRPW